MHYYIVDPQKLSQKKFERVQNILYSSLSEYRIAGEIMRITGLRSISQLVENAFSHEAKTIVAVGSDETFLEVINAVGKREIVIGFIPLVDSELGQIFGITGLNQAIKTIASRRVETVDLGCVNDNYFLSKITIGNLDISSRFMALDQSFSVRFTADGKYSATVDIIGGLIVNSRVTGLGKEFIDPTDGYLDLLLLPKISMLQNLRYHSQIQTGRFEEIPSASVIHAKKIDLLEPAGLPIKLGNKILAKLPATVTIAENQIRLIVGRHRNFGN